MAPPPVVLGFSFVRSIAKPGWGVQGAKRLEAPKNMHLTVPRTGSKIGPKHVDGCAFFQLHCSTKSQENSKRSKILNSQVSFKKNVYAYISSWTIFCKF